MEKLDINSEDWKKIIKGKSPEEIAEMVGNYYREQYKKDENLSSKRIIVLIFLAVFLILTIIIFAILFSQLFSRIPT